MEEGQVNYKATVMIVDDNPTNLGLLAQILESEGYKILAPTSGEKALQILEQLIPDIILLDIRMEGMDGYETCAQIKQNPTFQDIPILFITALAATEDKIRAFELGAVDYITKPIEEMEVLSRINTHLTLLNQKRKLTEENKNKNKFFSIIAHDLKSPIRGLHSLASLIIDKFNELDYPTSQEVRELITLLHNTSRQTYELTENLLQWTQSQMKRLDYNPTWFELAPRIHAYIQSLSTMSNEKQIQLHGEVPDACAVYADENMLFLIMRNLISNAIKFTEKGGKVTIRAEKKGDKVLLQVIDTGIGMDEKEMDKLFQINLVYTNYGTEGETGTGLGLILCREFLAKHGSELSIESKLDVGTTVSFPLQLRYVY